MRQPWRQEADKKAKNWGKKLYRREHETRGYTIFS